jgi:2,4-dienoyl-CoA reductase-like NADH-dependent reductase (Old Yellow Enzyme family)
MIEGPPGAYADAASQIKQAIKIQLIAVGKIFAPALGKKYLDNDKADLIAFERQMLINGRFGRLLYVRKVRYTARMHRMSHLPQMAP